MKENGRGAKLKGHPSALSPIPSYLLLPFGFVVVVVPPPQPQLFFTVPSLNTTTNSSEGDSDENGQ
ncbi:hypothetical protein TYRP_020314 [Tyrophagus putrescentiae]|nr:hypothetical protein TYRP_020314 [Tyrophagus putrescentiae]